MLLAGNNAAGIYPIKYFNGRFDAYQRTYVIASLDQERLTNRFLFYALQPQLELMKSLSTGAATKFLTLTILRALKLNLPPLPIQKRIAAILSAYDDLIEVNTRRIAILEEMARRIYEEWFVRYRFPGGDGSRPKDWADIPFDELADVLSGGTPKKSEALFWGGDIPFFTPKDAVDNAHVLATADHITDAGLSKCASRRFERNTVFITARGTVGRIQLAAVPMAINQSCYALVGKQGVPQRYLFSATQAAVRELKARAHGAVFDTIVKDTFSLFTVQRPTNDLMQAYEKKVDPMFDLSVNLQRQNTNLRAQRDLLLPRLVSGKLDVSQLDAAEEELADA